MKIAIFADTHLLDKFDKRKFKYLKNLIEEHDRIIINGDLWEGQIISFDDFINSEWSKLFPLLKSKKTIYILGNHDKRNMLDDRYKLFAEGIHDEYELKLKHTGDILHIVHGHKFDNYPFTKARTHPIFLKLVSIPNRMRIYFEDWLGSKIGWNKAKLFRTQNATSKVLKKRKEGNFGEKILVVSHYHYPVFKLEERYINTGMIMSHLASYISIEDGKMELIKETY